MKRPLRPASSSKRITPPKPGARVEKVPGLVSDQAREIQPLGGFRHQSAHDPLRAKIRCTSWPASGPIRCARSSEHCRTLPAKRSGSISSCKRAASPTAGVSRRPSPRCRRTRRSWKRPDIRSSSARERIVRRSAHRSGRRIRNSHCVRGLGNWSIGNRLWKQAGQFGGQLEKLGEELRKRHTTGISGGGMVEVEINGALEVLRCKLDPQLMAQGRSRIDRGSRGCRREPGHCQGKALHAEALKDLTGGLQLPGIREALEKLSGVGPKES